MIMKTKHAFFMFTVWLTADLSCLAIESSPPAFLSHDWTQPLPRDEGTILHLDFEQEPASSNASPFEKVFGRCAWFDQTSPPRRPQPGAAALDGQTAVTVEAWVTVDSQRGSRIVDASDGVLLAASSRRRFEWKLRFVNEEGVPIEPPGIVFSAPDAWQSQEPVHVAGTWNAQENMLRIFINGQLSATAKGPEHAAALRSPGDHFYIGNRIEGDRSWLGALDELRVSVVDRSTSSMPEHLKTLYAAKETTWAAEQLKEAHRYVARILSDAFTREVYADEVHTEGIYRDVGPSSSFRNNRAHAKDSSAPFYAEDQRAGRHLIIAGLVHSNRQLIADGLHILEHAFVHDDLSGRIPSRDENHSNTLYFAALCEALLMLESSDVAEEFAEELAALRSLFLRSAAYYADPQRRHEFWQNQNQYSRYTHRRYVQGVWLLTAWLYTGQAEYRSAAEEALREGLAQQTVDGINPENGGFDVSYQMVSVDLALLCRAILGPDHPLSPALLAMCRSATRWETRFIRPSGELITEGSTRTGGQETLRSGVRKRPNALAIEWAIAHLGMVENNAEWGALARQIENHRKFLATGGDVNYLRQPAAGLRGVIRIMPLGDSITQGDAQHNSYRRALWHLLQQDGVLVDFVGSQFEQHGGKLPPDADFDVDHEGHWGWTTSQVLERIEEWAVAARPDMVLLHLGTNNAQSGADVEPTIEQLGQIIRALQFQCPGVTVLVAQLIPCEGSHHDHIQAINERIPELCQLSTRDSSVVVVDQNSGFDSAELTYDGLHPNADGEALMASRWHVAILADLLQ